MTNEGDISVADWVHSWNKMHGDLSSDSFAWDKFAANMASFFTSDVSPFIERLDANGVAYLARKYKHKSDADAWVYSIFVNVPHSAHLVEVTATTVQDAHHDLFEELSPSMCQTAMRLTQPAADLTTLWSELGGVDEDAGGLPSLLAVSVMVPTSSPKDVERFLRKYGRNEVSHSHAKSSSSHCELVTMKMPFWRGTKQTSQFEGTYDITLKMVDNSVAAEDGRDEYALSAFEDYVNAQHLTHMSCDSGWDRYLDWHLGLYVRRVCPRRRARRRRARARTDRSLLTPAPSPPSRALRPAI